MLNYAVKVAAASNDLKMWQIADALGIHESTLSKRLRKELSDEEQDKIIAVINRLAAERGNK